jgi:thioesterase domain-containing protein
VGRNDDFFDLGGDSYTATEIATGTEECFGKAFEPAMLVDHSTVAEQAKLLVKFSDSILNLVPPRCVVSYHATGKQRPLFLVHGALGFTFFDKNFLEAVGNDQPIYLFHVPVQNGPDTKFETLQELAQIYVKAMQSIQPKGPYNIAAVCSGAFIGLEMCLHLQERGEQIKNLLFVDPSAVPPKISHHYAAVSKRKVQWLGVLQVNTQRVLAKFTNYFLGRGFALMAKEKNMDENSRQRRRRKNTNRIEQFRQESERSFEGLALHKDDMINAVTAHELAQRNYMPTNSFSGQASCLVNNVYGLSTMRDGLFWKNHVGSLTFEIGPSTHKDFFAKNIFLVAEFIKRNLLD